MVVSIKKLESFDYLIWLRSGIDAAERLGVTQSTVSRDIRVVSRLFGLSLRKIDREWRLGGDSSLLNLERAVHQGYRWMHGLPLRIEAQYYSGSLFFDPAPRGWRAGNFDFLDVHTPLQHLRTSVIDAWIGCYPDVPDADDQDFACFHLTRLPAHLVVAADHPLVGLGSSVTLDDVRQFPSLALPDDAFPKVQKTLQDLGLWNLPVNLKRYDPEKWEGRMENLVVGYSSALTMGLFKIPQVVLPLDISLEVGDTLIVRRQYADHPRLLALLKFLKRRSLELCQQFDEVRLP